jgi:hypothetical protein
MWGGDFAGNLWEGTFHGEWSYTDFDVRTPFWKGSLGYDYTFPSDSRFWGLKDTALVFEYFHNGSGTKDSSRYQFATLLTGREVALAQDYLGLTYSTDLHTLLKLEFSLIKNLNDSSHFFSPALQWNALRDLYLTAGLQRFGGRKSSEFGRAPNIAFLEAHLYF